MVIVVRGVRYWLWRAVDDEGEVLDFLVQKRRNARVARKLMKKLLKKQGFAPRSIVTDKLRSYQRAFVDLGLSARHDRGLRANQSSRELSSARSTTRAKATRLQVTRLRSTLPIRSRRHLQHLQLPASSPQPTELQNPKIQCIRGVGWRLQSCLGSNCEE